MNREARSSSSRPGAAEDVPRHVRPRVHRSKELPPKKMLEATVPDIVLVHLIEFLGTRTTLLAPRMQDDPFLDTLWQGM